MDNKIIHISTLNASLINSTSHFSFTMDNTIKDVIDLKLKSIEMPSNPYVFKDSIYKNTTFVLIDKDNKEHIIKIKDGNYKPEQLSNEVNDKIKLQNINYDIKLEYDEITGICSFTSLNNFSLKFPIITKTSLGKNLGFRKTEYGFKKVHVAEMALNLNPLQVYFLKINDWGKIITPYDDKVFAKLVLNRDSDICHPYTNKVSITSPNVLNERPVNLTRFEVAILDDYGNLVDFMGLDVSLSLEIVHIRSANKKEEIYEQLLETYSDISFFKK